MCFSKYELIKNNGEVITCPVNTSNLVRYICRRYRDNSVYRSWSTNIIEGLRIEETLFLFLGNWEVYMAKRNSIW